ncbi:unnamed protein product [Diatraea saccharalis]|uniref:Uncharacterized protein n=1 Tax=Diatraea saccharalis TaxID=40085 RepID=A0A9N9R542_9NEOP|nr:unnamed protein product [Diatraea saccharalis]
MSELKTKPIGAAYKRKAMEKEEKHQNVIKHTQPIEIFFSKLIIDDAVSSYAIYHACATEPIQCEIPTTSKQPQDLSAPTPPTPPAVEVERKGLYQITVTLNALGGVNKDGPDWAKYWAEKKCLLKKMCSKLSASLRQTGGVTTDLPQLSDMDKRFVAVMGGQSFACGDSQLAINLFPQMHLTSETTTTAVMETPRDFANEVQVEVPEEIVVEVLPSPSPTTSQVVPPPLSPKPLPTHPNRMARIEERRVEAERVTAEALAVELIGSLMKYWKWQQP